MTAFCSRLSWLPRRCGLRFVWFSPPLLLLLLVAAVGPARGWESGDLELFDLVEEVQLNFYQFLGVQQVSGVGRLPEGGAWRTETCGTGRNGGGGAGFALASSERVALRLALDLPTSRSPSYPSLRRNCLPPPAPLLCAPLLQVRSLSE